MDRPAIQHNVLFLIGVIIFLGFLIYSNTLQNEFVYDDYQNIVGNTSIQNLSQLLPLWQKNSTRFIPYLTFAVNYHFSQYRVTAYHLANILIHIASCCLIFLFFSKLFQAPLLKPKDGRLSPLQMAFFSSLVFLAHPLQTAAVASLSQRITLLATFFYVLTVWLYCLGRETNRRQFFIFALLANIAAMFSKENTLTLPFILLLCEMFLWKNNPGDKTKILFRLLPFFLTLIIVPLGLAGRLKYSEDLAGLSAQTHAISRLEYLQTEGNVFWTYLRLLIFPFRQNLDYDYPIVTTFLNFKTLAAAFVLGALFIWVIRNWPRHRLLSFGICWFFVTLSIESTIFPINDVIQEHRLYLPMLGFCLCLILGVSHLFKNPRMLRIFLTLLIIFYGIGTYQRNKIWASEITLWNDVLTKSPNKSRVYSNLGTAYMRKNNLPMARHYLTTSLTMTPNAYDYVNLGTIEEQEGKSEEAILAFNKAIALSSASWSTVAAYNNLGMIYEKRGETAKAIELFNKAIAIEPLQIEPRKNLIEIYQEQGQNQEILRLCREIIKLNPQDGDAQIELIKILLAMQKKEAVWRARELIRKSQDFMIMDQLGNILAANNEIILALSACEKSIRLNPRGIGPRITLGKIYGNLNKFDTAIAIWEEGLRIAPQEQEFRELIAQAEILKEQLGSAITKTP